MDSRPTIEKSVVESADSGIESTDSTADYASNPLRIGLWVRAFRGVWGFYYKVQLLDMTLVILMTSGDSYELVLDLRKHKQP